MTRKGVHNAALVSGVILQSEASIYNWSEDLSSNLLLTQSHCSLQLLQNVPAGLPNDTNKVNFVMSYTVLTSSSPVTPIQDSEGVMLLYKAPLPWVTFKTALLIHAPL